MAGETAAHRTLIGGTGAFPTTVYPEIVEVKQNWDDNWQFEPELELVSAAVHSAGQDLDRLTVRRRHGTLIHPWESSLSYHPAWSGGKAWWIRLGLCSGQGYQQAFIGQISAVASNPMGGTTGEQTWTAYGPAQILRKIDVSKSYWYIGEEGEEEEKELGWIPDMNGRDEAGMLVGNRTAEEVDDVCYEYGGTSTWTHYDYAKYLLAKFVDESDDDGPAWTLGGQAYVLKDISETIQFEASQTVFDILRKLIPVKYGLDFTVRPTYAGFEIFVYSLSEYPSSYSTKTLPANPNQVAIRTGDTSYVRTSQTETSADHVYSTIRVLGGRIICCCSLFGTGHESDRAGSLVPKWDPDLETEYLAGLPADPGEESTAGQNDQFRDRDRFRAVFQQFGAPAYWEFNDGRANLKFDSEGNVISGEIADAQTTVRSTLNWIPLREGYDYTTATATTYGPSDLEAEFLPPAAWLPDLDLEDPFSEEQIWRPVEKFGLDLSVTKNDWGIFINATPNHFLAKNQWDDAEASEYDPDLLGGCDYTNLCCTVAFETDQRLTLEYKIPGAGPSNGVKDVLVDDATLWYVAAGTVVGVDSVGDLQFTDQPRILRNDATRLELVMAGAVSRYFWERSRCSITCEGLYPWIGLIGQILTAVHEGSSIQQIHAPITSIEWTRGSGEGGGGGGDTTVIRTGFAL